jgi:succinate dehydrogenase / fumarate reductase, membrane anchor subunit
MSGLRTPLGRARGLGSAKTGVGRFIAERASGAALIFLCLWLIWAGLSTVGGGFLAARDFVRSPVNAALLVLTAAIGFYHMRMGLAVVIEDYIEKPLTRNLALLANFIVCALGAAIAIVSLLIAALGR